MLKEREKEQQQQQQQQQVQVTWRPQPWVQQPLRRPHRFSADQTYSSRWAQFFHSVLHQQQKKKRDTRKGRRKKDVDDDGEEKEILERLKKLSVPASDEEDEGR